MLNWKLRLLQYPLSFFFFVVCFFWWCYLHSRVLLCCFNLCWKSPYFRSMKLDLFSNWIVVRWVSFCCFNLVEELVNFSLRSLIFLRSNVLRSIWIVWTLATWKFVVPFSCLLYSFWWRYLLSRVLFCCFNLCWKPPYFRSNKIDFPSK